MEAEDLGSEDAVLSSEEEEGSAEVLLVFPPTMVLAEVQPASAESVSRPASANAQRFDDFFYQHQGAEPEMPHQTAQSIPENSAVDADAAAALTKLLANPSMAELIKNLAKNL